jgi:hypothetical protein
VRVHVCVCVCACVCVCVADATARSACGATTYAEGTRAGEDADEDEDAPPSSTSAVTAAAWRQMCILVRATPASVSCSWGQSRAGREPAVLGREGGL